MGALPLTRFKNNLLMPLCRANINCRKKICERERKPCLKENKSKRKKKKVMGKSISPPPPPPPAVYVWDNSQFPSLYLKPTTLYVWKMSKYFKSITFSVKSNEITIVTNAI